MQMLKQDHETAHADRQRTTPKGKDFHPGYSAVLVRTDLKGEPRRFRTEQGLAHDTHIERCLMSAGIELLLREKSLHSRWIEMLAEAARQDVILASRPRQIRGA
jgi:hypothetical protein